MLSPATVRKIIRELGQLRNEPLEDIRVRVDEDDVLQFVGIIAGPGASPSPSRTYLVLSLFNCFWNGSCCDANNRL